MTARCLIPRMRPAFLVLLSWAAAVPMAAFAAAAERLGRVPPPAFAYEATEIAGTVYAGSNDGLWCLAPDGAVRVHGGGDVSTPVAFGRATLYFAADGALWRSGTGSFRPRRVRLPGTAAVSIVARAGDVLFVDRDDGTWWTRDGRQWRGPLAMAGHGFQVSAGNRDWWALVDADDGSHVLSQSPDLVTWRPVATFNGRQPGVIAAAAGGVLITEIGGVRRWDVEERQWSWTAVGEPDERPVVRFAHGVFWLNGERDGLWRSADGVHWQDLAVVLRPLQAPLSHVGFSPAGLVLTGYTGNILHVPLASLPAERTSAP